MRKFRLTRDMVQAAPGGSTVVYTEEQVKAIRECALTRENQGRLLEYVAAGGHLVLNIRCLTIRQVINDTHLPTATIRII